MEGAVLHSITAKGTHEEKAKFVRGTSALTRDAAREVTRFSTPMRAYADAVEKGMDVDDMPSYEDLQRARRKNVRRKTEGPPAAQTTLGEWLDGLRSLDGGKWKVSFNPEGVCTVIHPAFFEAARVPNKF